MVCIAKQSRVRTHNPVTAAPDPILAQNTTLLIARAIGTFAAVMWMLPLVGALITREPIEEGALAESIAVGTLATVNVFGVVLAFRRERLGGMVLITAGAAFSIFAIFSAGRNQALAAVVSGGPFIVSGLLFILSSRQKTRGS
jgi:hypothetical protein